MSVALYKTGRMVEELNRDINRWLGGGITYTQINTALNAAVTALTSAAPTRPDTIKDTGATLNPSQPRGSAYG